MLLKQDWEIGGFRFSALRFGPIFGDLLHHCRTVAEDIASWQARMAQLCNYHSLSRGSSHSTWSIAVSSPGPQQGLLADLSS